MTEEVPLSEFVTEEEPEAEATSTAGEGATQADSAVETEARDDRSDRPVDPSEVSPAEATSSYDPAGVTCDGCGETVERRFMTEVGFRCVACVAWRGED